MLVKKGIRGKYAKVREDISKSSDKVKKVGRRIKVS